MRGTWLFPEPAGLTALEALLVLCRIRAMLRGDLPMPTWSEQA